MFKPLTMADVEQIVGKLIKRLSARLAEQQITLTITPEATNWLAKRGYLPAYGARPLERTITSVVETPLAKLIIGGKVSAQTSVELTMNEAGNGISFKTSSVASDQHVDSEVN
jgi:ATPases with chaperone activity, ATP-binding subunit